MSDRLRVIQWATGNVGRAALRSMLGHPELEVVGVLVFNPEKAGKDVGELAGIDPVGVAATTDADALLALDADCVLHAPLPSARYGDDPGRDLADLVRILESGKNAVTTVGYVYPKAYGEAVVEPLERACRSGSTSMHGTGLNPGWLGELLPLVMSGLSARIDSIRVTESTDFAFYPSPEIIFEMMGMGKQPAAFDAEVKRYREWLTGLFRESVCMIADGLGAALDSIETEVELERAPGALEIAAGRIEAGTIAGQRWTWTGRVGGQDRIVLDAIYRAHGDVAPAWPEPGCHVTLEGRPRMQLSLDESWISNGLMATGLHAVNAIPHVCRAEPGIRTFLDLPLITGRHTLGG